MLIEARRKTPPELEGRVQFDEADAERLPYPDEWFDLVTLANMIPFFDELDRVVAPGGWVVFGWSAGPQTPIYVPPEVLSRELRGRGYTDLSEFAAGNGTAFVARKSVHRLNLAPTGVRGTETPARTPFFWSAAPTRRKQASGGEEHGHGLAGIPINQPRVVRRLGAIRPALGQSPAPATGLTLAAPSNLPA